MADLDLNHALRSLADDGEAQARPVGPALARRSGERRRNTKRAATAGSVAAATVLAVTLGSSLFATKAEVTPAGRPATPSTSSGPSVATPTVAALVSSAQLGSPVVATGQKVASTGDIPAQWTSWTSPDPRLQTQSAPAGKPNVSCAVSAVSGRSDARTCTTTTGERLTMCVLASPAQGGHAPVHCIAEPFTGRFRTFADAVWPAKVTLTTLIPMGVVLSDGTRLALVSRSTEAGITSARYVQVSADGSVGANPVLEGAWDPDRQLWTWRDADTKPVSAPVTVTY